MITNKDIEIALENNSVIETEFYSVFLTRDTDGTNILFMDKINLREINRYVDTFDIDEILEYINEFLKEFNYYLINIDEAQLLFIANYYENRYLNKQSNISPYILDCMEKVYNFVQFTMPSSIDEKSYNNLWSWFEKVLKNYKLNNLYWSYVRKYSQEKKESALITLVKNHIDDFVFISKEDYDKLYWRTHEALGHVTKCKNGYFFLKTELTGRCKDIPHRPLMEEDLLD